MSLAESNGLADEVDTRDLRHAKGTQLGEDK